MRGGHHEWHQGIGRKEGLGPQVGPRNMQRHMRIGELAACTGMNCAGAASVAWCCRRPYSVCWQARLEHAQRSKPLLNLLALDTLLLGPGEPFLLIRPGGYPSEQSADVLREEGATPASTLSEQASGPQGLLMRGQPSHVVLCKEHRSPRCCDPE